MANPDLADIKVRRQIIQEIATNEDNLSRKREMQKRFDVYRDRQDRYIEEKMRGEFSEKTIRDMRKVLSINVSKKIIDNLGSIYITPPTRAFTDSSEKEQFQIDNLYSLNRIDSNLLLANRYFKLFKQVALMVVPKNGKLTIRPLAPMWYDVIPESGNPEKAFAYILNVWDFDIHKTIRESVNLAVKRYYNNDLLNQQIADDNDRAALANIRYVVWTNDLHFTMDGMGNITNEVVINPIGRLPFIDIAMEKDFQFFVRRGQNITEFAIDFGLMLSDLANISRLQSYGQAVIASEKQPQNMTVGPNHILFLQIDKNRPELTPRFEFVTPSPDLSGALDLLESQMKFFLSAEGIDTGLITGKGDSRQFSSGMDRLLAMLDKFEASKSDIDLFKSVEIELFDMMRDWSNFMQDINDESQFDEDLRGGQLGDQIELDVKFEPPSSIKTDQDIEQSAITQMEQGLMSRVEAVMKIRQVNEEKAIEIIKQIDNEDMFLKEDEEIEPEQPQEQAEIAGHTHKLPDGPEVPVDNVPRGTPHDHGGSVKSAPNDPGHSHELLDGIGATSASIDVSA